MKKYYLNFAMLMLAFLTIFTSCSKDDQAIELKQTGTLMVEVVDNVHYYDVSSESIYLFYDKNNSQYQHYLEERITDSEGKVDFGELNSGNYFISTSSYVSDSHEYWDDTRQVQVVSGKENKYTVELADMQ